MNRPLPTLSPIQTRALASLFEKQHTVQDSYPLTLNAVLAACNQKTSRVPVINADVALVQEGLDSLKALNLVIESSGGRVARYEHNLLRVLEVPQQSGAILAVLMLRGPQTAGELRIACDRLHHFSDISSVESFLAELAARAAGPLVVEMPRLPGARENRWSHLLSGEPVQELAPAAEVGARASSDAVENLTQSVARLEAEVARLSSLVGRVCEKVGLDNPVR